MIQPGHTLTQYDPRLSYEWNYLHAPAPVAVREAAVPGFWQFCGMRVASPLGIPAGPLLNGAWCLYYASLGFDVVTYKTVRSGERACYPLPNLQFVDTRPLNSGGSTIHAASTRQSSWAVSFGMPSRRPDIWRKDVDFTRRQLPAGKRLVVSVVGTIQPGWSIEELADDYAQCARWAAESGADAVEANFSCPNVSSCDGQLYQNPRDAGVVAAALRSAIGKLPLVLKIGLIESPEEARSLVDAVAGSVNALSMVNCISAYVMDEAGRPQFGGERRGIGGEAIRGASLEQVRLFRELTNGLPKPLEIIGVGGISTAEHVVEYLAQGAGAVQIATAAMLDPTIGLRIRERLGTATVGPVPVGP
jgi:dihydroorotate dehydrogenase